MGHVSRLARRQWRLNPSSSDNTLFAGHDADAANRATIASLVETCKLNTVEPHAYLTQALRATVSGLKQSLIDDLLPWNYAAKV